MLIKATTTEGESIVFDPERSIMFTKNGNLYLCDDIFDMTTEEDENIIMLTDAEELKPADVIKFIKNNCWDN